MGAIVPLVNSVEDAVEAAKAMRYPPLGGRSGGNFGTGFLGDDYSEHANDEIFLTVQIESASAVENAEAVMAVESIDGCWVGPGDLSTSMGTRLGTEAETAAPRPHCRRCQSRRGRVHFSISAKELVARTLRLTGTALG